MRSLFVISLLSFALLSCNQKKQQPNSKQGDKKTENSDYTISKDGIGKLKIGMTHSEVGDLLNKHFSFNAMKDSVGYWNDTVKTKYMDMDVSLFFERQYNENDNGVMLLNGVETTSPLCKTVSGIAVGDEKSVILPAYEDSPINMGPEWEPVNDSTWAMSKTKYSISVKDDKWDKELVFHLVNKKVVSLQAGIIMGD
jgi:hypothetical protein